MTQKVLKVGTSAAVTIPKDSMRALGLRVGDQVIVEVDQEQRKMTIAAVNRKSTRDKKIADLTMRFIERYRSDLLALAKK